MLVISLVQQKGGVGKTTLTGHLAVEAEAAGDGPVGLIDVDPQGSLAAWWNARQAETPAFINAKLASLGATLAEMDRAGYRLAFIDTPPAMTAEIAKVVSLSDLVVVPVKPSPHDLRAVGRTVELIEGQGKPFMFALTMAKSNSRLTAQAAAALSAHGRVAAEFIGDRVDFAASMIDGRTAREINKGRGASEISGLWEQVKSVLGGDAPW